MENPFASHITEDLLPESQTRHDSKSLAWASRITYVALKISQVLMTF